MSFSAAPAWVRPAWPGRAWFAAWLGAERGRFALFLPVCMGAGILSWFAAAGQPALWSSALATCVACAAAKLAWRRPVILALSLAVCAFMLGEVSAGLAAWRAAPWLDLPHHAVVLQGRIARVEYLAAGRRVTFDSAALDDMPASRAIRVRLRDTDTQAVRPGDVIRVRALVRPPPAPAYPGGWDMQREDFFNGIGGYGFALAPLEVISPARQSGLEALRGHIAARALAALPGSTGAIAATLLTGLGAAIPAAERQAFSASGLSHLLAVAGLHIGIVMGLAFAAARWLLMRSEYLALHWQVRRVASAAALAAGFGYLLLSGGHVPIWRSFAMACLVTLGVLTGRQAISMRGLALAALALELFAPAEVMGVSFQMSFAAVMCLIAGWEWARPRLDGLWQGKVWRGPVLHAAGLVVTSGLAGTAALPFAAYHFGTAAIYYVPANMLAVPLTALWIMPWGLLALLLMPLGLDGLAWAPMGWGISGVAALARGVAAWPDAVLRVPCMPPAGLLAVALGMVFLCLWRTRLRLAGVVPLVIGLASPWAVVPPDVVVAPDGAQIAVRAGALVFTESAPRVSPFEQEVAARIWGGIAVRAFGDCSAGGCDVALPGGAARLARGAAVPCTGAALLVSAVPLRGACPGVPVIDRFSVLRNGATFAWVRPDGVRLLTDRDLRGARPWFIGPAPRAPAALPMAQTE